MTNKHSAQMLFFIASSILLSISGCNKIVDTQNQEFDLSKITATGTQSPQDFIGTIDLSDWSPSNYNAIVFGKSFWIQKPSFSDTLFFGGRSAGDTISQLLKIYNSDSTNLSMRLQLQSPFFVGDDSIEIPSSSFELIRIYFILPDTTNTVHNDTLTLHCSTGDSVLLKLQGYRAPSGSGGPVNVGVSNDFSLAPAYPNPTDGEIRFEFSLPQRINALLKIVNTQNELVAIIGQDNYAAGAHSVSWNAALINGNYRVVFQAGNYVSTGDIKISR